MENDKVEPNKQKESKKIVLRYLKALAEVIDNPFLIIDINLKIILANSNFYETFKVLPKQTENEFIYELGNGQWNIPKLRDLLEKILPEKKVVKNYEVTHVFEAIGEKTILINARQFDSMKLIVVIMEDITEKKRAQNKTIEHMQELEAKVKDRTKELADKLSQVESINKSMVGREIKMMELKKEIENLKNIIKKNSCGCDNKKM
ncbi:MAG: PAS domain-containing protein [Candidatus Paceibacterota bacterium]